jgi:hypothetical protein
MNKVIVKYGYFIAIVFICLIEGLSYLDIVRCHNLYVIGYKLMKNPGYLHKLYELIHYSLVSYDTLFNLDVFSFR